MCADPGPGWAGLPIAKGEADMNVNVRNTLGDIESTPDVALGVARCWLFLGSCGAAVLRCWERRAAVGPVHDRGHFTGFDRFGEPFDVGADLFRESDGEPLTHEG